jgi:NitT/TauT family transport system substrate-binding protein
MALTVAGRALLAVGIIGLVGGGIMYAKKGGGLTKMAGGASPTIKVGLNTWSGFIGVFKANNGLKANVDSDFYKKYGVLVDISIIDDAAAGKSAFLNGDIDVYQATVDSVAPDAKGLSAADFKYIVQTDWSYGGDAIVVRDGITNVSQLRGKTIAVTEGSPSHTLLINVAKSGGLDLNDVTIVKVNDGLKAGELFKAEKVDAAVVWSPDDQACIEKVKGSMILVSTKKANRIIADALYAKADYIQKHPKEIKALVEGILAANAAINSDSTSKEDAIKVLSRVFNQSDADSKIGIENARLATLGDNKNFFGLNRDYNGVTAEDLYSKMGDVWQELKMCGADRPMWRNIVDTSVLQSINLVGPAHDAEPAASFEKISVAKAVNMPAFSNKKIEVNFGVNSAELDATARGVIRSKFAGWAQGFEKARILIEGNTDNTGPDSINIPLSRRRAESAKQYIVSTYGVDPNRITVVGNGARYASASAEPERANDRRTDFKLQ